MKKYPNVSLKIIFKYKNRILMLRNPKGRHEFPGGRMEWGESIFGALKRELKEELDYNLKEEPELFSVWNYISKNKKCHIVIIHFIYPIKKRLKLSPLKKFKILWLTKKDLIKKNIIRDKEFLNKIFNYEKEN
jgi:ADP-ribose pyrophosphatase YjhB (NUDIX family)